MSKSQSTAIEKNEADLSVRLIALVFRFMFPLTILVALLMIGSSIVVLLYARRIASAHELRSDFLVNVAAGLVEIAIGLGLTAIAALALAKYKLQQISRPILALIQRLRIDRKLTHEGARRSVVCAVALLSESNVGKTIEVGPNGVKAECPICAEEVQERMDKCFYCELPKTIWRDRELVDVHRNNPEKTTTAKP